MPNPRPSVSAVVPTYNCAPYLAAAIDSVLAQTHPVQELVVVDDGSSDGTAAVLAAYRQEPRVTVIRQRNRGQAAARNRGLAASGGEFVGFCDADDLWRPEKIERQLEAFAGEPEIGVVYTDHVYIDDAGRALPTPRLERCSGWVAAELLVRSNVPFGSCLFRRQALAAVGGFDERLSMGDDYDLLLRVSARYRFRYLDLPLYHYRLRSGQLSDNVERRFANALRTMARFTAAHPDLIGPAQERRALAATYLSRGRARAARGRSWGALADFGRSLGYRPVDVVLWKSLLRLLLGWRRLGD